MQARKRLTAYANETNVDNLLNWVFTNGPAVIGSDWLSQMFYPDRNGVVTVAGSIEGGHCYLLLGQRPDGILVFRNSWGTGWGDGGTFYMTKADLQRLLDDQGD